MSSFTTSPWMFWVVIGILFVIIEIFDPIFFFLSIGSAAIITGLLATFIHSLVAQVIIFAVLSIAIFFSMKKLGKKLNSTGAPQTNVSALIGKTATVVKTIPQGGRGYVKVGGEEWSAICLLDQEIPETTKVKVMSIEGNKLIVEAYTEEGK